MAGYLKNIVNSLWESYNHVSVYPETGGWEEEHNDKGASENYACPMCGEIIRSVDAVCFKRCCHWICRDCFLDILEEDQGLNIHCPVGKKPCNEPVDKTQVIEFLQEENLRILGGTYARDANDNYARRTKENAESKPLCASCQQQDCAGCRKKRYSPKKLHFQPLERTEEEDEQEEDRC